MPRLADGRAREAGTQGTEEGTGDFGREGELGRKLDEDRAEAITEAFDLRGEAVERRVCVDQPLGVGDLLRQLDCEAEAVRHGGGPARVGGGPMRAMEGR